MLSEGDLVVLDKSPELFSFRGDGDIIISQELIEKTIEYYGRQKQLNKAKEELLELALAITHYEDVKASYKDVCEEIADVEIMCAQLRLLFPSEEVGDHKQRKIERLAENIGYI